MPPPPPFGDMRVIPTPDSVAPPPWHAPQRMAPSKREPRLRATLTNEHVARMLFPNLQSLDLSECFLVDDQVPGSSGRGVPLEGLGLGLPCVWVGGG